MTSMSLTELITNQFYEVCNYSDYNVFSQFIKSLSVGGKIAVFSNDKNGPKITYDYSKPNIGPNLYLVILVNHGKVIVMSKNDIEKFSGLNLWVNHDTENITKPLRLTLYKDSAQHMSPNIIVTDLPEESIIYTRHLEEHEINSVAQDNTVSVSLHRIFLNHTY